MTGNWKQTLEQYAEEFILGIRSELAGPEAGFLLLCVLETVEQWEQRYAMLEAEIATLRGIAADMAAMRAVIAEQRDIIEVLLVDNDNLCAELYFQQGSTDATP
jgi:hypothetical protein